MFLRLIYCSVDLKERWFLPHPINRDSRIGTGWAQQELVHHVNTLSLAVAARFLLSLGPHAEAVDME